MLVTTNNLTQETEVLEVLPATPLEVAIMESEYQFSAMREENLVMLGKRRIDVESRGNPDEYDALATAYDAIGATANANTLRRKAAGMRGAR